MKDKRVVILRSETTEKLNYGRSKPEGLKVLYSREARIGDGYLFRTILGLVKGKAIPPCRLTM